MKKWEQREVNPEQNKQNLATRGTDNKSHDENMKFMTCVFEKKNIAEGQEK